MQVEAAAAGFLEQQVLHRLRQQTYVGGKRVDIQKLPRLPKSAATTVHRVKVSLYGAKPPVWRRLEIPSAMTLDFGQGIQDVGVNDDHEVSRLPAEALPEQLIGSLGHVGPPAVTDPDERRQEARSPVAWKLADEWLKQPESARRLLLAEPGDKLLQLLLGCHMFSLRGSVGYR